MAINKEVKTKLEENDTVVAQPQKKEINMNDTTKLVNLCPWQIGWKNINNQLETTIPANGTVSVQNSEIEVQVLNNNPFLCGTGEGNHARVIIDSEDLKAFPTIKFTNQIILTDQKCKEILDVKDDELFRKKLEEYIVTNQEKRKLVDYVQKVKFDSYSKIKIIEEYTEIKM